MSMVLFFNWYFKRPQTFTRYMFNHSIHQRSVKVLIDDHQYETAATTTGATTIGQMSFS
jgi:hypothetical protein